MMITRSITRSITGIASVVLLAACSTPAVDTDVACEGVMSACEVKANDAKAKADRLEASYSQEQRLVRGLREDVAKKDVEITRLNARLTVRVLDSVLFESGSTNISDSGRAILDKIAGVVSKDASTILVEGHSDDVPIGPALKQMYPSNWELSSARAAAVARYFQFAHNIAPNRLSIAGFANYKPLVQDKTDVARQRNRRVEIKLTPKV